ncbi:MAG: MBL fold metallo-hydrolase [Thiohalomonadaceae bacterium]
MRFASLGSGSRGNATLVEQDKTLLLVDCGFSLRETERRLLRLGREPSQVTAILLTHEHSDHAAGVDLFARRHGVPIWLSAGTRAACNKLEADCRIFNSHTSFAVHDIEVTPFPVPHDAREPTQFVFGNGARRIGLLTDTGSLTPHIEQQLTACDALLLECNHDREMLLHGVYPPSLKARVDGDYGHLNNAQAAELLRRIDYSALQHIAAAHISDKNNTPQLVTSALAAALDCQSEWIAVVGQDDGLPWRELI